MGGVISDLNILCLGNNKVKTFSRPGIGTDVWQGDEFYWEWKRMLRFSGTRYYIFPQTEYGEYDYSDGFFDLRYDKKTGICYLKEREKFAGTIKEILWFYLRRSPDNALAVLFRLSQRTNHKREYRCSAADFFARMQGGEIRFDYIYHLSWGRICGKRVKRIKKKKKKV